MGGCLFYNKQKDNKNSLFFKKKKKERKVCVLTLRNTRFCTLFVIKLLEEMRKGCSSCNKQKCCETFLKITTKVKVKKRGVPLCINGDFFGEKRRLRRSAE